jgi:CRP-like cAMP-binding protein
MSGERDHRAVLLIACDNPGVREPMGLLKSHKVDFRVPDVPITKHAAGATIVKKGEPAQEMFLVRKGRFDIQVSSKTVDEVGPGGIFGEVALIDHAPRSASAGALEDSKIIRLTSGCLSSWFRIRPISHST